MNMITYRVASVACLPNDVPAWGTSIEVDYTRNTQTHAHAHAHSAQHYSRRRGHICTRASKVDVPVDVQNWKKIKVKVSSRPLSILCQLKFIVVIYLLHQRLACTSWTCYRFQAVWEFLAVGVFGQCYLLFQTFVFALVYLLRHQT